MRRKNTAHLVDRRTARTLDILTHTPDFVRELNSRGYRHGVISFHGPASDEHASVSAVEQILGAAATRSAGPVTERDGRALADRAVWFCACVTFEDAPTWLIYDTDDGKVGWCRVPVGKDIADVVDSPVVTGSHVDPDTVLTWLKDPDVAPTPGDGSANGAIVRRLGLKIRDLQPK